MIKIDDLRLTDVAAKSTLSDNTTRWIYESIDYVLKKRHEIMKQRLDLIGRIHYLTEQELDLLLWEYHVEASFDEISLETKRKLILESLITHMKKGTKGAVENISSLLVGNTEIIEWYKYGGTPGTFKIKTEVDTQNTASFNKLINIINTSKNVRSHLDSIESTKKTANDYYIGIGILIENHYQIEIRG
ncbi:phage tail protein I [Leptotrichia sp. oral taxon 879]|uniref:phage tail protein I n=1 Tax=Leptotrichia sp. oral taxon 879 TaxID=1227267 RepID=UPI0003AE1386|nr:phage tail protein I [Leptotrichia sp. oral taxon 879]ERK50190.1 phage tail protein [Leptotrichia sp. oral taxon 879 str. F0557]